METSISLHMFFVLSILSEKKKGGEREENEEGDMVLALWRWEISRNPRGKEM